ncbi:MAG: hypothetical protein Q7S44_00010 [bacterium]|nr:hypothetical protein [bacterium]
MSDGGRSGIGQMVGEIQEAVVKPVVDEVGKAIEEGAQAVAGTGQFAVKVDPQAEQKKKTDEAQRKQWALRVIEWNKKLQEAQARVRQEQQQKEMGKRNEEEEKKKVKQFETFEKQQKRQQVQQVAEAQRKTEIRKGVGG